MIKSATLLLTTPESAKFVDAVKDWIRISGSVTTAGTTEISD